MSPAAGSDAMNPGPGTDSSLRRGTRIHIMQCRRTDARRVITHRDAGRRCFGRATCVAAHRYGHCASATSQRGTASTMGPDGKRLPGMNRSVQAARARFSWLSAAPSRRCRSASPGAYTAPPFADDGLTAIGVRYSHDRETGIMTTSAGELSDRKIV